MENRKNGTIAGGIQEFVRMPTCPQWPGFGFAISNHAAYKQIRIIECSAISVRDGIAKFAAFVNRARRFRSDVAGNSAGKRKLFEEMWKAFFVLRNVRVDFAVRSFEVGVRDQTWAALARTCDGDHIEV